MSTTTFHVTSADHRRSIEEHGLDWRRSVSLNIAGSGRPEGECIFLARDRDEAEWFVELGHRHHHSLDIWEVTLPHDLDPYDEELPPGGPYVLIDGFLAVTETVPVDRLRLVDTDR